MGIAVVVSSVTKSREDDFVLRELTLPVSNERISEHRNQEKSTTHGEP